MTEPVAKQATPERKAAEWPKQGAVRTDETIVGLAEIQVKEGPCLFSFIGLGSCVGLCALDPVANVSGAVHVMLPRPIAEVPPEQFGKFASTGIEELVRRMVEAGAERTRIVAAYAGGACVGAIGADRPTLDFGQRNLEAVELAIKALGLTVAASDAGGTTGRTLKMMAASGEVFVRTIQKGEAVLCTLRAA